MHPVIDYNYIVGQPVLGGELSFNTHARSLTREPDWTAGNHPGDSNVLVPKPTGGAR